MGAVAAAVAVTGPLGVLALNSRIARQFERISPRLIVVSLAWGGLAFYGALRLNTFIYTSSGLGLNSVVNYVAPVVEETLKAILVVFLVRTRRVHDAVHCLLYGLAIGTGFAVVENLFYLHIGGGLDSTLIRVGSTSLMHATSTALVGLAVLRLNTPAPPREHHWADRHPHVAVIQAALAFVLRVGVLRVFLVKGIVLKGVLLRSLLAADSRHAGFNTVVNRPVDTVVIIGAVGLGVAFEVFTLWTAHRLAATELNTPDLIGAT